MLTPEQLAVNSANNKLQAVVMEAELSRSPSMSPEDVTLARLMSHPFVKEYSDREIELRHDFMASDTRHDYAVRHYVKIQRASVCELVEPAKPAVYRCVPLLSDEEEGAL